VNAEARSPLTIPALVGALGTGNLVVNALVALGEQTLPAVMTVAMSTDDGDVGQVSGALLTLARLWSTATLTDSSRRQILDLAGQRMRMKQHALIWGWACELALTTGDSRLRASVEEVAAGLRLADVLGPPEAAIEVRDRVQKLLAQSRK
jgi:hypothetical protein